MTKSSVILLIIALLVLGAAGYTLFGKGVGSAVTSGGIPPTQAELTFIALTNRIDPIEFDASIISDPRFMALRDIRTAILPEASGRTDPFAPFSR